MTLTSPEIALGLEAAEARHLQLQVETYARLWNRASARAFETCGGIAAFTEPLFGRKLNHVTGLGMGARVTAEALAQLERAYGEQGLGVEIDLCPHADGSALTALSQRGFEVNAFSNTYVRRMDDAASLECPKNSIVVEEGTDLARELFVPSSVAGFSVQATRRPKALLETLARIAAARSDTTLFVAHVEGQVAGSAGLSVLHTPLGRVAHLYIASTLPAFRNQGVQSALLRARLLAASRSGCVLSTVTARPSNASARNVERAGFSLAYTKLTFVKAFGSSSADESMLSDLGQQPSSF